MMDEERRKEAQRRLTDEERVRRLSEGGESMKAQLAMEEAERSSRSGERGSYLTPQEEQQRRVLKGSGDPYRGYGETQRAEMAMWEGGEGRPQPGGESMEYRTAREIQRDWRGSQGAYVSPSEEELRLREQTLRRTPSDVDMPRRAPSVEAPAGGGYGMTPVGMTGKREEERRTEPTAYRAGSGSYYSETFERPTGTAGPESSFGRTERMPSGKQYAERGQEAPPRKMMTREEMRRSGYDETAYPAGSGSYYSETFERPSGTAGPESSFGRTERMPSGQQYARREAMMPTTEGTMQERTGERPSGEMAPTARASQAAGSAGEAIKERGGQAVSMGKDVGSTVVSRTKGVTSQVTSKAREFSESNRAEDVANRAGEALGRAIRKTVSVAREMSSGVRKGLEREEHRGEERRTEERMPPQRPEGQPPGPGGESVEREEYTRQTPKGEERRYQETRKRESE